MTLRGHIAAFMTIFMAFAHSTQAAEVDYVQDIEYLLKAFETRAGGLLKVKGIDWSAVKTEFRAAAEQTKSDQDHLVIVLRLIGRLRDGHAGIIKTQVNPPDTSEGRRMTGPRVALAVVQDRVVIRAAFKDAVAAGLHAGQEVTRIDDVPAQEWLARRIDVLRERGEGFSTAQMATYWACHWGLADYEGTRITFERKDSSGELQTIERIRNGGFNFAAIGPLFPPPNLQTIGRQSYGQTSDGLGYIHLRDVPGNLPLQIQQMLAKIGPVPGLILDMRANGGGGCDHDAVFGHFLAQGQQWRGYTGKIADGFTGPLVVIVDAGTRSAGETIAGMFKEDGRGYMIGESASAGMSSQKKEITTPSGLFTIRFSVASNQRRFNEGRGIEGIGVVPHEIVLPDSADLLQEKDTLIDRAATLLKQGLPKKEVPFEVPNSPVAN